MAHRTRTHTHLKQESAFAARRLHVRSDSMVNEGEVMIVGYDHVQVAIPSGAEPVAREYYGGGAIHLTAPLCWPQSRLCVCRHGLSAGGSASVPGLPRGPSTPAGRTPLGFEFTTSSR